MNTMLELAGIAMLGAMSPGPDFAVVVKNSLIYSRKTGLFTALGISIGALVHISYTLLGLGLIISQNPWLMHLVRYLGAAYLLYIGWNGLRAKQTALALGNLEHRRDISIGAAMQSGFLTGALNPKAMLFFISLFSVMIPADTPPVILFADGAIIFIEILVWFSFIAFCLSGKRTREKFNSIGHWIERFTGGILFILGARLFFF